MSDPKDRYINPDIGYYGQTAKIGDTCYVATGRTGDMTDFFESKPPTFKLQNHACVCDFYSLNASDHMNDNLQLGSGGVVGHFDASVRRVDMVTENGHDYVNLQTNALQSSTQIICAKSYIFAAWIKPRSTIGPGHYEVNIWDHRENNGADRHGYIISLSSNDTNNDGTLSVLIGKGTGERGWISYSVPGITTWAANTRYHVAVIQNGTSLKVYINNVLKLNTSTIAISSISPSTIAITSLNTSAPHPVSFSNVAYMTHIPDLPLTFLDQHYNGIKPTPAST